PFADLRVALEGGGVQELDHAIDGAPELVGGRSRPRRADGEQGEQARERGALQATVNHRTTSRCSGSGWPRSRRSGARASLPSSPPRSRSTGGPEGGGSYLAEDVLGEELLDVDRRLHLGDPAVGLEDPIGAPGADADVLLADQPLRLDGRDRVLLDSHPVAD